ncbi:hypothetical protein JOC94_001627 [Bacillus thermophilus]|uniref:Uncharacterized protein n=1 Tax=Siminovitchia thermophila TaxID=1245522 RepID=A0ABS2R4S7_9BACI|nr:hypothetical protein [Siminovitchia thermophila]
MKKVKKVWKWVKEAGKWVWRLIEVIDIFG